MTAVIVFTVVWAQITVVPTLVLALAAGVMLLTLMFGTTWLLQPRRRTPEFPRYR